ncbi:MAG: aspartate carbamoyltransferase [Epsilonproteobacteria bacterium]|nr:MAG: aspartate carbamoyltransferase [Campylobacterota bacterium]RLA67100.1 MAG: aspartate carbamoyltransferase [Campylobacterota bacterium]
MSGFPKILESTQDLSKGQISTLISMAKSLKEGQNTPFFFDQDKRPFLATLFLENSTRTKTSFAIAAQKLGAHYIDFDVSTSSLKKGESLEETLLTLKYQGVNACVIRTPNSGELAQFKKDPPLCIINGGDGTNQHPTQALLDLFTLYELGLDPQGKTFAIIGDIAHSRVASSLVDLLTRFGGKIVFCGPKECLPKSVSGPVMLTESLDEALELCDVIYTLRIQKERHTGPTPYYDSYHKLYGLNLQKMQGLKKAPVILHPGPVNIGVELSKDLVRSPFYKGYEQVINSIYMRMAIISATLGN